MVILVLGLNIEISANLSFGVVFRVPGCLDILLFIYMVYYTINLFLAFLGDNPEHGTICHILAEWC